MFPLKERIKSGYAFGVPTHYNDFHIGYDYKANTVSLYAPFNGFVKSSIGSQGGVTITFKPDHDDVEMRFLHLSGIIKRGRVKEGEIIALTGNSGLSDKPHLHLDISKHKVDLGNLKNFIDPEQYNWNPMPVQYPIKIKIKLVINGTPWATLGEKIAAIESWYFLHSEGKLQLQFTSSYSNFPTIPIKFKDDGTAVIDEPWFDANVFDPFFDNTTLVVRDEDLPDYFPGPNKPKLVARTFGFMGKRPTKTIVACSENEQSPDYPVSAFVDGVRHELMHSCYLFAGIPTPPPYGMGSDWTHKYFNLPHSTEPGVGHPEGAFSQLNYENINKTLMAQNQAKIVKSKKSSQVYIAYPIPSETHLKERASLEGIDIPVAIPNTDSL